MLGLDEFFENTWQSVASSGSGGTTPSHPATTLQNVTMSNFGPNPGVTTVGIVNGISTTLPVLVNADFSLWCPVLGVFVAPEQTNLMTKLSE